MKIFEGIEKAIAIHHPVVTIGTFDGVHLGHQKIISRINQEAKKIGGESVLVTFHPHPRLVLNPLDNHLKLLQTQEEKIQKLTAIGLDNLLVYPFSPSFANWSAEEFVRTILVEKLGVKILVIGYDHQFGKNREGGLAFLQSVSQKYNFEVIEISAEEINDVNVSSTKIRAAIDSGKVDLAKKFLGDFYELHGTVVEGQKIGRELGFPTANLDIKDVHKLIPQNGVYAVDVTLASGEMLYGMMNIGSRPSISAANKVQLEVFLFDFTGDLYGQKLRVRLHDFVRNEKIFDSRIALTQQIQQDEKHIKNYFHTCMG